MQVNNPYPGLRPFEFEESEFFFGREGLSKEILRRLQKNHFLAVVGTSGSGKSSLVRAGLLPLLYAGFMGQTGSQWRVAVMRPGDSPICNLANSLVYPPKFVQDVIKRRKNPLDVSDEKKVDIVETILRRSPVGLVDHFKGDDFAPNENLLVVVDQFEELFRYKANVEAGNSENNLELEKAEEKVAFVKRLLEATRDKTNPIYVVITMRSDFLGNCSQFRGLPEAITDGQYLIPRLTRDQLRDAIEKPAEMFDGEVNGVEVEGVEMSPVLVNQLLNDIGDDQDQLPVLQHALMRTWKNWADQKNSNKPIDLKHYEKIGGLTNALSKHLDDVFNKLPERQQRFAEKMFKCLTELDSENREVRRPTTFKEICDLAGFDLKNQSDIDDARAVIDAFSGEGRTFITVSPPDRQLAPDSIIDISHESLIRNWTRLKAWVVDEAKSAQQYRRLVNDAFLYSAGETPQVPLWRDPLLELALKWRKTFQPNEKWASRYNPPISDTTGFWAFAEAMNFLDLSESERKLEQYRVKRFEQEKLAGEIERQQLKTRALFARKLQSAVIGLVFLLLVAVGAGIYAFSLNNKLTEKNQELEALQKKLEEQNKDLGKKSGELENSLSTEKGLKEDLEKKGEELEDSLQTQTILTNEAKEAKEQADEQARQAQISEKKAKDAQEVAITEAGKARIAEAKARDSETNALGKVDILNLNWQGLISAENNEYQVAKEKFDQLLEKYKSPCADSRDLICKKEKAFGEWWGHHNLATAYSQLGDFDKAKEHYEKALRALENYEKETTSVNAAPQMVKINFLPISNIKQQTDLDVVKGRIITLRKLAQFYRNRAINEEDEKNAKILNSEATKTYNELLVILGRSSIDKKEWHIANAQRELADIYYDLDRNVEAKDLYIAALNAPSTSSLSSIIPLRRKLLALSLRLEDFSEAERQTYEIIKLREDFLNREAAEKKGNISEKVFADTYGELASAYREQSEKFKQVLQEKINQAKDEATDPKLRDFYEELLEEDEDNGELIINPQPTGMSPEQRKIWEDTSKSIAHYKKMIEKAEILSTIPLAIKFDANTTDDYTNWFEPYEEMATTYLNDNQCDKTIEIISLSDHNTGKLITLNSTRFMGLRLSTLGDIANFYAESLYDNDNATKFYQIYDTEIKKLEVENRLPFKTRQAIYDKYYAAGSFFYGSGKYAEARKMFNEYLRHLDEIYNSKEHQKEPEITEEIYLRSRVAAEIYIGRTHRGEKNIDEAIKLYEKIISDPRNRLNIDPKSPNQPESNIVDTNLSIQLANLYFEQGDIEKARSYLTEETHSTVINRMKMTTFLAVNPNFIEEYISITINMGNSLRKANIQQATRYYQNALGVFDLININFPRYRIYSSLSSKYFLKRRLTTEYYNDYISLLKTLEQIQGTSEEISKKIEQAEKVKKDAPPAEQYNELKPKCVVP